MTRKRTYTGDSRQTKWRKDDEEIEVGESSSYELEVLPAGEKKVLAPSSNIPLNHDESEDDLLEQSNRTSSDVGSESNGQPAAHEQSSCSDSESEESKDGDNASSYSSSTSYDVQSGTTGRANKQHNNLANQESKYADAAGNVFIPLASDVESCVESEHEDGRNETSSSIIVSPGKSLSKSSDFASESTSKVTHNTQSQPINLENLKSKGGNDAANCSIHLAYDSESCVKSEHEHEDIPSLDSSESDSEQSSASSEDWCSDSYTAHYLDEDPEQMQQDQEAAEHIGGFPEHPYVHEDPEDPDDPDDPGSPNGSDHSAESSSSDESDEEDNAQPANILNNELLMQVQLHLNLTKGEVIVLELANAIRHKKTFESVLDSFRNLNVLFGNKCFPENKPKLWSVIDLNRCGMKCHVYCGRQICGAYIGRKDRLGDIVNCRQCQRYQCEKRKARFFVTLDFKKQLKQFLLIPGMWEKLQYPRTRVKRSATALEDIYDGAEYKRLQEVDGFLSNPNNCTYTFNLDGCKATKKGTLKIWPCYARINELPPEMRQKFSFVVAVYVDHCDPNFHSFLKPIVRQLNHLSTTGITWNPQANNRITTKFAPLCECVDAPARAGMLNMSLYNTDFGCTFCTHMGIRLDGSQRFPIINLDGIPDFAERTDDTMRQGMERAHIEQVPFQGHKGTSPLLLLQNHDLRAGQAVDDLHQDHEGCAADITRLLLTEAPRVPLGMAYIELVRQIDNRLLHFKTPSRLSRKPRTIRKWKNFNGSEWRNWLFFYSVPCLTGLIDQESVNLIAKLSYGCYLLAQDSIEENDINRADRILRLYARNFEERFGVPRLKYNLHVTTSHKVTSVRQLGPPFCTSTYNFESLNCKLTKFVTSPKGAAVQILTRSLLNMMVHSAQYDQRISEEVRERLQKILNKERLQNVLEVGPNMYLVGKSIRREASVEETNLLQREGFPGIVNFQEYKSALIGNTRYRSVHGQNPDIRSDDTCIYTTDNTYCTLQKVIAFHVENGEVRSGFFVVEHDIFNHPIAQHLSVINPGGDLPHFILLNKVLLPAVSMTVDNIKYVAAIPNCFEID